MVAALRLSRPGSGYVSAGTLVSPLAVVVTVAVNVPLNSRRDASDPTGLSAADALRDWTACRTPWTAWNHVRTGAGLLGWTRPAVGLRMRG